MARVDRINLMTQIQGKRGSCLICYLTSDRPNASSQIQRDVMPVLVEHLRSLKDPGRVDILLFTNDGETIAAFGAARLLREFADHVGVLIPDKCHSAGTLFALGANQCVMTRGATLSPIIPSVSGPLNPTLQAEQGVASSISISSESVEGFLDLVQREWHLTSETARLEALKLLADRVHPLVLGNVHQVRKQVARFAHTLLEQHCEDEALRERIVSTLTRELEGHDYWICRREARNILGDLVADEDPGLETLIWELYRDFAKEMELGVAYSPLTAYRDREGRAHTPRAQQLVVVESVFRRDVFEKKLSLTGRQRPARGGRPTDEAGETSETLLWQGWRQETES